MYRVGLGLSDTLGLFAPIYVGVANILPVLLTLFSHSDRQAVYRAEDLDDDGNPKSQPTEEYDFIVVGGGTSGSVVANRLSQQYKVLLIERGGNPNPLTQVPGMEGLLRTHSETDYMFVTNRQERSCLSCFNQQTVWNQGLGLGGSSMLNSMEYLRGHQYDYDLWAYYAKDKRWKYKNLLPYFLRSEDYCFECDKNTVVPTPTNDKYHSIGGELPLMKSSFAPLLEEFLKAMSWAGLELQDLNAPFRNGAAGVTVSSQRNSRRASTFTSFIEPIQYRPNLRIMRYTRVIKVMFEGSAAIGVQYERFGKVGEVNAKKEVILSCGAINTPKILLLSGIGPASQLNHHKIPVRLELPVGENLQDHVGTFVGPILLHQPRSSYIFERDTDHNSVFQFLQNGTGPLSFSGGVGSAFWASNNSGESSWPDIHVQFTPHGVGSGLEESLARNHNLRLDVLEEFLGPLGGRDAFFLRVNYGRPKSRGSVRLKSSDFMDDAVIDPKYYQHPDDMRLTVEALQKTLQLAESAPAFRKLGAKLSPIPLPPCKAIPFRSGPYWECVARHFTLTLHDYSGTAGMGPVGSSEAVVDPELRVLGAQGLRVVDASVMPFITTTGTYAPTIMIGERGADFILETWKTQ